MSMKTEIEAVGAHLRAAEQDAGARLHRLEQRIESWFATHIHNSPASRDTAAFNHIRGAVDALKRHLAEEI